MVNSVEQPFVKVQQCKFGCLLTKAGALAIILCVGQINADRNLGTPALGLASDSASEKRAHYSILWQ